MAQITNVPALLISILLLSGISCGPKEGGAPRQPPSLTQGSATQSVAGVQWKVPARWTTQAPRQMRVATYSIPSERSDEVGECAVFYFGAGQGGDVEANMQRWIGQFEDAGQPKRSARKVGDLNVSEIDLSGTYRTSTGPMMAAGEKKEGYRLLGAIVEAPQGLVFFKLTGPATTVASSESDFNSLVESLEVP